MKVNEVWKKDWIDRINPGKLDIFPIQFANCDRLAANDAVYIFDEVGSGKTVCSGLMAMHYLYNNKQERVLVITTNTLFKGREYGQFLKEWYDKLPFEIKEDGKELKDRVSIKNNSYSSFTTKEEYGLVIIDEAHMFLNTETNRFINLTNNIRAKKIVFLTATPIKNDKNDLEIYCNIASTILDKNPNKEEDRKWIKNNKKWIQEIDTEGKEGKELICSKFDENYAVTRYFKDTIKSLKVEGFERRKAKRLLPELWEYDGSKENKKEILLKNINSADSDSRFIIFTRFVKDEAESIKTFLQENGFEAYNSKSSSKKMVKVVTGENSSELKYFEDKDAKNLPKVLILTYQIAEQGVNLPDFNYVVNYHISAFPSALEQRFGRIDRLNSNYNEIHMSFLISTNFHKMHDSNTFNFWCAVRIYMNELLSYLPSKNTMISSTILEKYKDAKKFCEDHIENLEQLAKDGKEIKAVRDYCKKKAELEAECNKEPENLKKAEELKNLECECSEKLWEFIEEYKIEYGVAKDSIEEFQKKIEEQIEDVKDRFKGLADKDEEMNAEEYERILNKIGDKIFYRHKVEEDAKGEVSAELLETIDAIGDENEEGCGWIIGNDQSEEKVDSNEKYRHYKEHFDKNIKLVLLKKNYSKYFNKFFEEWFNDNQFEMLFPLNGYESVIDKLFERLEKEEENKIEISMDDKKLIIKNIDSVICNLPFFRMCNEFKEIIQSFAYIKDRNTGYIKIRRNYTFNPFTLAMKKLGYLIKGYKDGLGLSKEFIEKYWSEIEGKSEELFGKYFKIGNDIDNVVRASNWYKLAYEYLRKEKAFCVGSSNNWQLYKESFEYNPYFAREEYMKEIWELFAESEFDEEKFYRVRYEEKLSLCEGEDIPIPNKNIGNWSLFSEYLYSWSGVREYIKNVNSMYPFILSADTIEEKDRWSQGIYFEICRFLSKKCDRRTMVKLRDEKVLELTWGDLMELPEDCAKCKVFL